MLNKSLNSFWSECMELRNISCTSESWICMVYIYTWFGRYNPKDTLLTLRLRRTFPLFDTALVSELWALFSWLYTVITSIQLLMMYFKKPDTVVYTLPILGIILKNCGETYHKYTTLDFWFHFCVCILFSTSHHPRSIKLFSAIPKQTSFLLFHIPC